MGVSWHGKDDNVRSFRRQKKADESQSGRPPRAESFVDAADTQFGDPGWRSARARSIRSLRGWD